jgi:4-amino-4-deoxy-L-arabinose transferase-like glycosyltransferase
VIVLLGVVVRVGWAVTHQDASGWGVQVVTNANIAHNLIHGGGYTDTVSPELNVASDQAGRPLTWAEVQAFAPAPGQAPLAYYLPGYPYTVAAVWKLTGQETYGAAQAFQALADATIGCLASFVLLLAAGRMRAGLLAAAGYAVAPPLVLQSTLVLPDSLAAASLLLPLACIAGGFWARRPCVSAIAAGVTLGFAGWLRGDAITLLPFVLIAVACVWTLSREMRLRWSAALVVAWAVPTLLLGGYFLHIYDEFHLTRPGAGILLWEAIGQQDNPWDIKAPPGRNLDAAAIALTQQRGLPYGSWQGDDMLRSEALDHMKSRPGWFIAPALKRFVRVATIQKSPEAVSNLPGALLTLNKVAGPLLLLFGAFAVYLLRDQPLVRNLLVAAWLSKVTVFSFLRDELRFEILIVALYVMALAVVLDFAWDRFIRGRNGAPHPATTPP